MTKLVRCTFQQGRYNNYLIGGNVCNAFALGAVGSKDDFFLIGAEPPDESSYPLLTGNILDSEGNLLFRLVRNVLVINPGHCSKIIGDHIGYEIHDGSGNPIFSVVTKFEPLPGKNENWWVTTIAANFYRRNGELVFSASSGEDEHIEANVKAVFGFSDGFGLVQHMEPQDLELVRVAFLTHGAVYELMSGEVKGKRFDLDGKFLTNAHVSDCDITVKSGNFIIGSNNIIHDCKFGFVDEAKNIRQLILSLEGPTEGGVKRDSRSH